MKSTVLRVSVGVGVAFGSVLVWNDVIPRNKRKNLLDSPHCPRSSEDAARNTAPETKDACLAEFKEMCMYALKDPLFVGGSRLLGRTRRGRKGAPPKDSNDFPLKDLSVGSLANEHQNPEDLLETLREKVLSQNEQTTLLLVGTQNVGKSSLIDSLFSLMEGHYFHASAIAPTLDLSRTLKTRIFTLPWNPNWALVDVEGFEVEHFQQVLQANRKNPIGELVEGTELQEKYCHKPDLALIVVSPEQARTWEEILKNITHGPDSGGLQYVVVITHKDQVGASERAKITQSLHATANINEVYWVTNFDPGDCLCQRSFEDYQIQWEQLKFWEKIFKLVVQVKRFEIYLKEFQNTRKRTTNILFFDLL